MFAIYFVGPDVEPIAVTDDEGNVLTYETGKEAAEAAKCHTANPPYTKCQPRPLGGGNEHWRQREADRLMYGRYERAGVLFDDYSFTCFYVDNYPDHYLHVSKDNREMVAFTESDAKGRADIQTRMKVGRYLSKYFSSVLSAEDIDCLAKRHIEHYSPAELLIASEADDIEHVYINGPSSCMSHDASDYGAGIHPTRAYAGPDLAVGYIQNGAGHITARAVIWPERKIFTRIYGDSERMRRALHDAGYNEGGLEGARMQRIPYDNGIGGTYLVVPYVDFIAFGYDDGEYIWLGDAHQSKGREIHMRETCGTYPTISRLICSYCEDEMEEEDSYSTMSGEQVCAHCANEHYVTCEYYDELVLECDATETACGSFFSNRAIRSGNVSLYECGECNATILAENLAGETSSGRDVCDGCAENMECCPDSGHYHNAGEPCSVHCETCNPSDETETEHESEAA